MLPRLLLTCLVLWGAGPYLLWGQGSDTERLYRLFREAGEQQMEDSPELATYRGDTRFNDRWTDLAPEAIERRKQHRKARWAVLQSIDRSRLMATDQLNYDLFTASLGAAIERDGYSGHLLAMDPLFNGPHISVASVLAGMPARTAGDYANYLARLRAVPKLLEQTIALLEEGRRRGVTQPRLVMRDVPAQLERLTAGRPEDSPFLVAFRRFPAWMPEAERAGLQREAARVVDGEVFVAFRRLREYLEKTYIPACRESIARAALPKGKQWYAVDIRQHTTTTASAREIHELGQSEVKRIRAAMEEVMRETRFSGSLIAFVDFLRKDPRFYYSNAGDLLMGYRDLCKRIEPELPRLFLKLPRRGTGPERRTEAGLERSWPIRTGWRRGRSSRWRR